jgi:hypothetical protein
LCTSKTARSATKILVKKGWPIKPVIIFLNMESLQSNIAQNKLCQL